MKALQRWLPAIIVCVSIFYFSAQQGLTASDDYATNYLAQKSAHLVLYFTLCFCFYRGTKSVPLAVLFTILYGISDEIHQQFVPTRNGQFLDVVIDSFAASLAGLILWKYYQNLPKKLKNWLSV